MSPRQACLNCLNHDTPALLEAALWMSAEHDPLLQPGEVPLRLIDGGVDPISGAHMLARYRELVPNPDCVLLENIGHYPQTEAPDAVLRHYLEFRTSTEA